MVYIRADNSFMGASQLCSQAELALRCGERCVGDRCGGGSSYMVEGHPEIVAAADRLESKLTQFHGAAVECPADDSTTAKLE
jgi:hypothetical protein